MILNGKVVSQYMLDKMTSEIKNIKERGVIPHLAIVSVGEDPASKIYVNKKIKTAEKMGMKATHYKLDEKITEKELLNLINKLNIEEGLDGFIVQLPLPKHINQNKIINLINPNRDVDGFHPVNVGKMFLNIKDNYNLIPATPYGIMKILDYYRIEIEGMNAVIVGRSNIVGKPMASMLLNRNATVVICHSKTKKLEEWTKKADILVVAVGKAKLITSDMVKENASVIDVGMNRLENGKLCGDVDFDNIIKKANCTPVPGGVGPMTVTMLMYNTLTASKRRMK